MIATAQCSSPTRQEPRRSAPLMIATDQRRGALRAVCLEGGGGVPPRSDRILLARIRRRHRTAIVMLLRPLCTSGRCATRGRAGRIIAPWVVGVAEPVDAPDLGSGGATRGGSSPLADTRSLV